MKKDRVIELLQDQLNAVTELNKNYQKIILDLTAQVHELTLTISSLQEALTSKEGALNKQTKVCKNLTKLLSNESEQQQPVVTKERIVHSPKERGNNGAKRKPHYELEEEIIDIYPDDPRFDPHNAREIGIRDSIRYLFIPPRFIKRINRLHIYSAADTVISAKAPLAPFQNSQYDGSFIAGMCQLRYIYSMSVERIIGYFRENGFALEKSTAHGLLAKTAGLFENLYKAMQVAVLDTTYLSCDETYYTILVKEKNSKGKAVRKGYIWVVIAVQLGLVYYFYEDGSRSQQVILDLLKNYQHTIQSDAYAPYKKLESNEYPHITRLACFQHVKRKFMDIKGDKDAEKIVELINELYHKEHQHRIGQDGWKEKDHHRFRQQYAPPILKQIKKNLVRIKNDPNLIPKSDLYGAVEYMLSEWNALEEIFNQPNYKLDNNIAERHNRYIALSRKNSLFFGSHQGAKRGAILYSLACSCRANNINFFEYLADVINKTAALPPNTKTEVYREWLPDRWKKND
ncbi:IS66 family transposase [Bacteroides sp. 519]|uniref:IS66 family transposase n=1 Tax=Bacteroides sp. 519 TaxID=2302937 RepID=UPI0013D8AE8F|nr:IS66 family transposase [Bacteroides sp. 519]NDV58441.1 IS66 family transposase [Bacteroides sp. 519]